MAHTYTSLHYHCIFSTLGRRNLIPQDILHELYAYLGGILKNLKCKALAIGGTTNYVHLLIGLPPSLALSAIMGKIKSNSTRWAHKTIPSMSDFHWQEGYGAFTVSRSQIEKVSAYINNQAKHHQTITFEEEYIVLLKKHNIEYEERYVFD